MEKLDGFSEAANATMFRMFAKSKVVGASVASVIDGSPVREVYHSSIHRP